MADNELYENIKDMAALQFSTEEIAAILEIESDVFSSDQAAERAFFVGRLKAQAEVRKAMLQLAKQGSTPAQKMFNDLAAKGESEYET